MQILIIEDEAAAVRRLQKLLQEQLEGFEIVGILDSIESSVQWFLDHDPPDLTLLDIHLSDGSSFVIFEHVDIRCPIIFVTAYDEYALEAFRVNAIDYIMKPVKAEDLQRALQRFRSSQVASGPDALIDKLRAGNLIPAREKRVLIRIGQHIKLLELHNAAYLYSENKIVFATMQNGKRYPLDYSLDQLENMLDSRDFFRVNRQYIINLKAIDEMFSYSKSRVKIILTPPSPSEVIVSTERSSTFKKWLVGKIS